MEIADRKIIVDHIIDQRFTPALMQKLAPFIEEVVQKRVYSLTYAQSFGVPIAVPQTQLDLRPEFEALSKDILLLMEKS